MAGDGLDNCGPLGNDICARSLLVNGGAFDRATGMLAPATISDFRLDKYEVTVGRFRKFVDGWVAGWRPGASSGRHTHLNAGAGLVNSRGGMEAGWDTAWTAYVGAPSTIGVSPTGAGSTTKASWDSVLTACVNYSTWTTTVGANEKRPQTCLSWYDLYAFCIWDGGFLPSEAEWAYAATGGSEQRSYPWGAANPGANASLAIYGCYYNGTGTCSGVTNIAPVGSVAAGAGRWGHLDPAGNAAEWTLDIFMNYDYSCANCSALPIASDRVYARVLRGGSAVDSAAYVSATSRLDRYPSARNYLSGGRCARNP